MPNRDRTAGGGIQRPFRRRRRLRSCRLLRLVQGIRRFCYNFSAAGGQRGEQNRQFLFYGDAPYCCLMIVERRCGSAASRLRMLSKSCRPFSPSKALRWTAPVRWRPGRSPRCKSGRTGAGLHAAERRRAVGEGGCAIRQQGDDQAARRIFDGVAQNVVIDPPQCDRVQRSHDFFLRQLNIRRNAAQTARRKTRQGSVPARRSGRRLSGSVRLPSR